MTLQNFIGTLTLALAPILGGAAAYWLAAGYYRAALVAVVCVVLCMELRVRAGWRAPRPRHFYLHVLAGVLLLLVLGLLAWRPMPVWMPPTAGLLILAVGWGGGRLLVRQYT